MRVLYVGSWWRSALCDGPWHAPPALRAFPQVVDIMRVNVDKVLERDQKLSELDDRADALQAGASQFETSAAKLKRKYWWKNLKVRVEAGGRAGRRSGGGWEYHGLSH